VVTVTAQVVNATALQGANRLIGGPPNEARRVSVTGTVDVVGGSADLEAYLEFRFTPDGGQPPVTLREAIFPTRTIAPGSFPFDTSIDLNLPLGTSTEGTAMVRVTGTDANGGVVDVGSSMLPVADTNTQRPPATCVADANTLCALGDARFKVNVDWKDFDGNTGQAMVTDGQRFPDGGWFFFFGSSAALDPDGFDVFAQLLDNCTFNDHFWVFASATTNVEYTITVTDTQTNLTRSYSNPLGNASPAVTDTQAFATCP
jgi:hypothetical protein